MNLIKNREKTLLKQNLFLFSFATILNDFLSFIKTNHLSLTFFITFFP